MRSLKKPDQWVDEPSWASPQHGNEVTWNARRPALDFLRVSAVALGTAAFWMFLIWAIHRESPRTLVSFHGFVHAAIADKFLDPASTAFPPENPFFAGRPVSYYWFFQFLAAQLARYLGWNIFYSLEAVTLAATGILVITAVGLGRALYRSTLTGIFMSYLVMAGTNPFGFLFAGWKIASRGTQVLLDDPNYLWGVVHPVYSLIRYNDFGGLYGPLLNFFLNQTSRPAALACLMAQVFCLEWALRSRTLLPYALLGCASAITSALSPITGISAGGALVLGLAGYWLWQRREHQKTGQGPWRQGPTLVGAGVAVVVGILVAAPTYYHLVFGPSDSQPQFWLFSINGLRHLVTVTLSVSLLMILAVIGIRRTPEEHKPFIQILFFAAIVLFGANLAFVLPAWNQSNFFHAAVVILAIPAAASILRNETANGPCKSSPHSASGFAVLSLIFLPTVLLLVAAYLRRPPLPATFENPRLIRLPDDSGLAHLYRWVQNDTSRNAIFVIDPRLRVAMLGNIAEFPAMTGRAIFTEELRHYMVEPYSDAKTRFDIAVRLVSGNKLSDAEQTYLSDLKRPVYVVSYHPTDNATTEKMRSLCGLPVFNEKNVFVFEWSARALSEGERRGCGIQLSQGISNQH